MFDWILGIISSLGYFGVFGLMFLENLFPPIPSELIMPLAGFLAARGEMNPVAVVLVGTLGSVVGALPWYWLGRRFGYDRMRRLSERHGFWLTVEPDDLAKARDWFERHGWTAVLFGRLVPAVRTVISVPAGIAGMHLVPFLGLTFLGSVVWTAILAGAGYLLQDQYSRVEAFLDPGTKIVVGGIVAIYLWRIVSRLVRGRGQARG
jgi:membrane protein DedA with SNARE-associated domain